MPKLHLADLSKTCLNMPDTDKSVSALATNGHVLDKSKTNPLENYLACLRDVLDNSARWSLGIMSFSISGSRYPGRNGGTSCRSSGRYNIFVFDNNVVDKWNSLPDCCAR